MNHFILSQCIMYCQHKGVVKFCHPFIYLKPVPNVHVTAHFVTLAESLT